jgi:Tol biopolymer transport system component
MVGWLKAAVGILVCVVFIVATFAVLRTVFTQNSNTVPNEGKYGIYALDLSTNKVALVYSTDDEIYTSALRLNSAGDTFVFAQKIDGADDSNTEIFTLGIDGQNLKRLTSNGFLDLYPVWSPDDSQIAFLSKRDKDLDIYIMNADGNGQRKLYDSGSNDADIDWAGDALVFTSGFSIWRIKGDGTSPTQVTNLSNAGQWGTTNLPVGDYDPRLRSDGAKIVFERLEDPNSTHGSYDLFVVNVDGTGETRLTDTGYSQGLANWSHDGATIAYVVAAIGNEGKYDLYVMNADGTSNHDATPSYFPASFLCYSPVFSKDDSKIYFIGQWS